MLPTSIFVFLMCISFWLFMATMPLSLNSSVVILGLLFDEVSVFMVFMTFLVIFISIMVGLAHSSGKLFSITMGLILVACIIVFCSPNIFILYLFYEASLIPILFIIITWGSYPERSLSSIMLLVYTSIFTFPFLYVILNFYFSFGSFYFLVYNSYSLVGMPALYSLIIFLTFAVKLPIYGLHYWLPMAHVEAPTFGSIILAGVLLNLGGVGLVRFWGFINLEFINYYFLGYMLVFLVFVTLVCCFQSDFKRLIAYSSVSHMMAVPIMIVSNSFVGLNGLLAIIFMHGVSSPLLFIIVGVLYSITSTRQHFLMRGVIVLNPLLSLMLVLSFFFTLSAPPFPSFISEVLFVFSSLSVWFYSVFFLVLFLFLSIVYNLLWFGCLVFSSGGVSNISFSLTYLNFYPIFICLAYPIVFMSLFYFI